MGKFFGKNQKKYTTLFILISIISFAQNKYYVSCDTKDLILADYQNCTYQVICNTGMNMFDIAITPNGNLYSTDGKRIFKIDKLTCTNTTVTPFAVIDSITGFGSLTSLVALDNNYLLTASYGEGILYKIDIVNGTSSIVDTIGYESGGDLTWYNNKLFYATINNELVEITLNSNFNQITNVALIGNFNSPLESIYGVLTIGEVSCKEDNLKVLAFEYSDVYKVNTQDASIQMLCPNLFPCVVYGGASLSETQNKDHTSEFLMPNVFTPNNDNVNDMFKPALEKNIVSVDISIYNRWGNLVYKETGETFNWNGLNFDNKKCIDGVYFYMIEYKNSCDDTENKSGYLTLIN